MASVSDISSICDSLESGTSQHARAFFADTDNSVPQTLKPVTELDYHSTHRIQLPV